MLFNMSVILSNGRPGNILVCESFSITVQYIDGVTQAEVYKCSFVFALIMFSDISPTARAEGQVRFVLK